MTRTRQLLLPILLLASLSAAVAAAGAPTVGVPRVTVLADGDAATTLRFEFPLTDAPAGTLLRADELRYLSPRPVVDVVGERAVYGLPRSSALLALPRMAAPTFRIVSVQWHVPPSGTYDPSEAVGVGAPQLHRGVPVAPVYVRPRVADGVVSAITFVVAHAPEPRFAAILDKAGAGAGADAAQDAGAPGVLNPGLRARLASGATIAADARAAAKQTANPFTLTANWLRIEIAETGVHAVTGMHTALAGVSYAAIDPAKIRVYRAWHGPLEEGQEQPGSWQEDWNGLTEIAVDIDSADQQWDAADAVRFYAAGPDVWSDRVEGGHGRLDWREHPYADRVVYWLTWENFVTPSPLPGTPLRIQTRAAAATGGTVIDNSLCRVHLEQNDLEAYGRFEDDWAWDTAVTDVKSVPFTLAEVVPGEPAFFQAEVRSYQRLTDGTATQISAAAWLNAGDLLGETAAGTWHIYDEDNPDSLHIRLAGWTTALLPGLNSLKVANTDPAAHPIIMFDSADVLYRRYLVKSAAQLEFAHWGEEIGGSEAFDFRLSHATGPLVLWDVSDPAVPMILAGQAESATVMRYGLVRSPSNDFHARAWSTSDLLAPTAVDRRYPGALHALDGQVDYLVLHPASLTAPARRLAQFRADNLPEVGHAPAAEAIDVERIYDAFGGGVKDPTALRNFLKWLWLRGEGRLVYVCLLGDASRDHRNVRGQLPDLVPTYVRTFFPNLQVGHSYSPYATDDYLVSFDQHYFYQDAPDLVIGRLPVHDVAEAEALIDVIEAYELSPPAGDWRNRVVMVADDFTQPSGAIIEDDHTAEAEILVDGYVPATIDVTKVYLLDYEKAPGGEFKPQARQAAKEALNSGTTMFHYIGHGAEVQLADEQVFLADDIYGLHNGLRRGIFLAFSCDVGVFDSSTRPCMAEIFLGQPDGGAIAAIAASQVSYIGPNEVLSEAFYAALFPDTEVRPHRSIAAALNSAKLRLEATSPGNLSNSLRYNFFGDPAQSLPHPASDLAFAAGSADTLRASRMAELVCVLSDNGIQAGPDLGYRLDVAESREEKNATMGSVSLDYWLPGAATFRGNGSAVGDTLRIPFRVPSQLRFGLDGRARLILSTPDGERAAYARLPVVRAGSGGLDDVDGPAIDLAFENRRFRVKAGTPLNASIADTSGVSVLGTTPLNSVLLEFDASGQMSDVSDLFTFEPGSYTSGRVSIPLPGNLETGEHRVALFASDVLGNVGTDTLSFRMVAEAAVAIQDVALFPNPTAGPSRLVFELSDPMEVEWTIHSLAGHPVRRIRRIFPEAGPQIMEWDGRDGEGDELANGVYLYVVRGRLPDDAEHPVRVTGKLVLMK